MKKGGLVRLVPGDSQWCQFIADMHGYLWVVIREEPKGVIVCKAIATGAARLLAAPMLKKEHDDETD